MMNRLHAKRINSTTKFKDKWLLQESNGAFLWHTLTEAHMQLKLRLTISFGSKRNTFFFLIFFIKICFQRCVPSLNQKVEFNM